MTQKLSLKQKNLSHFTKIKENLSTFKNIYVFEMKPFKTRILHQIREKIKSDSSKIVFGKKTVIKKAFDILESSGDRKYLDLLTANTFLLFTNQERDLLPQILSFNKKR